MKLRPSSVLQHRSLQRSLDRVSSRIPDPAHKLWFIQKVIARFEEMPAPLRRIRILRSLVFRYVTVERLGELTFGSRRGRVLLPRLPLYLLYRGRLVVFAVVLLGLASGLFQLSVYGYGLAKSGTQWVVDQISPPSDPTTATGPALAADRIGAPPKEVWLVERDDKEEFWSNGLRIDTTFQTRGDPRQFFAFPRDGSPPVPMGPLPVGIVYHASESDMAPFGAAFNRDILATTRDLIGWLSRRRIYNYVIDRFGQVYRVVDDEGVAIHAGVSIWGDDENFYLNLNDSFIGVAFESQWSQLGGDAITTAQIQAALNLTDLLRARYGIEDANCVPHGLVSVNAGKKLIGYHADWARNFPFGPLGLTDKYQLPPPSIVSFGFRWDDDLVERLGGELWPGVALADRELDRKAEAEGIPLATLRARLQRRYLEDVEIGKLARSTGRENRRGSGGEPVGGRVQ